MPLNSPSLPDNLDINSTMPKLSSEGDSEKFFWRDITAYTKIRAINVRLLLRQIKSARGSHHLFILKLIIENINSCAMKPLARHIIKKCAQRGSNYMRLGALSA